MLFCSEQQVPPVSPHVSVLLDFLTGLFNKGLSYSAINTAKSAVNMFVSTCTGKAFFSSDGLVSKFMRGVFTQRPALPKYAATWDTAIVLKYLRSLFPLDSLSLLLLSQKLAMLLVLLSGQRGQAIHGLLRNNIEANSQCVILRFGQLLKTSKPGRHLHEIVLPAYGRQRELCVVHTYLAYIRRTLPLRGKKRFLFISTIKPHAPIARDTLGNWIRNVLTKAGVDMQLYSPHSTRGAATSKAKCKGVSIQTIIKTAGWSSDQTFRKFYDRPITRNTQFADSVLDKE